MAPLVQLQLLVLLGARLLPLAAGVGIATGVGSAGVGLWLVLAWALWPGALVLQLANPQLMAAAFDLTFAGALGAELLRGMIFALASVLPLYAFRMSGALGDLLRGADALELGDQSSLARLYGAAALALFCAADGHLLVIRELGELLHDAPLAAPLALDTLGGVLTALADLIVRAFELALSLAAPIGLCLWLVALIFGVVARVAGPLIAGLEQTGARAVLGLGVACLGSALILPQAVLAARVFLGEAQKLLHVLG